MNELKAKWLRLIGEPDGYDFEPSFTLLKKYDHPEFDGELYLQKNGPDTFQRVFMVFPKNCQKPVPGVVVPFYYPEAMLGFDPETGEECPVGVQGEMCNRGYNTMKGYYKNPEATAEVIDENGFLHSGDLGVKDENGNYRITGRIKDMIIRGGENIYPREIEEFLYQMEGIKDVQVAGIPSKRYGEAVGAFIILHEGVEMNEFDVREFCEGKIARYKIPKDIFFIKEFPMTGSGKIQKFKLKDLGLELCKQQGIEIV